MTIASQDYRDGAAYEAAELARRINAAQSYGLKLSNWQINTMADEIATMMGGHEPIEVQGEIQPTAEQHGAFLQAVADANPHAQISDPWTGERVSPKPPKVPGCGCVHCNPGFYGMYICSICGNKRCPHAADHRYICTGSNEPGQVAVFNDDPTPWESPISTREPKSRSSYKHDDYTDYKPRPEFTRPASVSASTEKP